MKRMFSTIIMPIADWKPWHWERGGAPSQRERRPGQKARTASRFSVTPMNTAGMPKRKSLSASIRSACTSSWSCPAPCLGESAPSRRSGGFQRLHHLSKATRTRAFAPKWQRTYKICTRVKDDNPPTHLNTQACDPHTATLCSSQLCTQAIPPVWAPSSLLILPSTNVSASATDEGNREQGGQR